jgi:hypothetical protein
MAPRVRTHPDQDGQEGHDLQGVPGPFALHFVSKVPGDRAGRHQNCDCNHHQVRELGVIRIQPTRPVRTSNGRDDERGDVKEEQQPHRESMDYAVRAYTKAARVPK